jgi:hypothetical protein
MAKKASDRKRTTLSMQAFRSALTNGSSLFAIKSLDERSSFARRYRDLIAAHTNDLGGPDVISEAERALLRRACMLVVQCELLECKFAENDGQAADQQLMLYQRTVNTLRRALESLGPERRPRDVTPQDPLLYARAYAAPEPTP